MLFAQNKTWSADISGYRYRLESAEHTDGALKLYFLKQDKHHPYSYIRVCKVADGTDVIETSEEIKILKSKEDLEKFSRFLAGGDKVKQTRNVLSMATSSSLILKKSERTFGFEPFNNSFVPIVNTSPSSNSKNPLKTESPATPEGAQKIVSSLLGMNKDYYDSEREQIITFAAVKRKTPAKNTKREYMVVTYNKEGKIVNTTVLDFKYPREIKKKLVLRDDKGQISGYAFIFSDFIYTRKKFLDPEKNSHWFVRLDADGKLISQYKFTVPVNKFRPLKLMAHEGDVYCFASGTQGSGFKATTDYSIQRFGSEKMIFQTLLGEVKIKDINETPKGTGYGWQFVVSGMKVIGKNLFVYGQNHIPPFSDKKEAYTTSILLHTTTDGTVQGMYSRSSNNVFEDNQALRDFKKHGSSMFPPDYMTLEYQCKFLVDMELKTGPEGEIYWMLNEPFTERRDIKDPNIVLLPKESAHKEIKQLKGLRALMAAPDITEPVVQRIPGYAKAVRRPFIACIKPETGKIKRYNAPVTFASSDNYPFLYRDKSVYLFGYNSSKLKYDRKYILNIMKIDFRD